MIAQPNIDGFLVGGASLKADFRDIVKIYASKPFDLKVLKTDLGVYISADEEIIDAENKIGYLETVVDYIKGVIKSVDNRGWDIKNAIEWKKFEAGLTY